MRTLWIIAGLRRSGIHPVVNWIKAAIDTSGGPHVLLNNVHLAVLNSKDSNVVFSRNFASSDSANEHVLVVFEDKRLRRITESPLLGRIGGDRRKHLIVLRDPYNLVASRLERTRRRRNRDTHPRRVAELWPDHASHDETWIRCVYNRWFTQESYRRQVAAALDLPTCPPLPNRIARAGRGSSFDGVRYDGRVVEMPVLDRWRKFADDAEFQQYVNHPRLATLSDELCGFPNPLKEVTVGSNS